MERTIKPEELKSKLSGTTVIDVRREADYTASAEALPGSTWHNPEQIDSWLCNVPKDSDVVIYCVRGGAVSNSVVDKLQSAGVKARFIEGGIEGWKAAGGKVAGK